MGRILAQARTIIKNKPYLAWDTKADSLSETAVLEHILNYGDWDDFMQYLKIVPVDQAARLFSKTVNRKRSNYYPQIEHYFTLFFKQYASQSFK
ncbi:hypothetical protein KKD62_02730 [Patescibacteria group bacterium]|nr:hypothetical protein [Patescibacteria group bacterium]MBU1931855.1 hypothetical protein [Patescibacteria group bacterium]